MAFDASCACGKRYRLKDDQAGRRCKCSCGQTFVADPPDPHASIAPPALAEFAGTFGRLDAGLLVHRVETAARYHRESGTPPGESAVMAAELLSLRARVAALAEVLARALAELDKIPGIRLDAAEVAEVLAQAEGRYASRAWTQLALVRARAILAAAAAEGVAGDGA